MHHPTPHTYEHEVRYIVTCLIPSPVANYIHSIIRIVVLFDSCFVYETGGWSGWGIGGRGVGWCIWVGGYGVVHHYHRHHHHHHDHNHHHPLHQ